MHMQQAPNCSKRTHKSNFFSFQPNGLKNASETISAVGKMKIPSKKYIIIPKNSLHYSADRVLGNTPQASESFSLSRNQHEFQSRTPSLLSWKLQTKLWENDRVFKKMDTKIEMSITQDFDEWLQVSDPLPDQKP